eukprot:TRINITY_DN35747_c0_g1_i1.p1 TRINITY_DN35747_c0_g1~~TRINITY_DN35747_c0_g1_i1.p1  ORF type:complete len:262 (+),score=88.48 TRINITY_DN35747_c0_g1_i1:82-867(+)
MALPKTKASKAATKALAAKFEELTKEAHSIITEIIPNKILHLEKLFPTPKLTEISKLLDCPDMPEIEIDWAANTEEGDRSNKKRRLENGTEDTSSKKQRASVDDPIKERITRVPVKVNKYVVDLLEKVNKEAIEMSIMYNTVKLWIQLSIPRIEDGNNFGVGIQEETIQELGRAEDAAYAVLEGQAKYHLGRAKLASKALKYPDMEDYMRALIDLDKKEVMSNHLMMVDQRNNMAIVHDMLLKNIDKIIKPRNNNAHDSMY